MTNIGTTAIVDDFTVNKCHSGGVFFYQRSTNVKLQNCKFDRDVRTYPNSYTTTMQVDNCYIEGNLFNFADGSNIIVNNSLIHNNWYQDYSAATSFNNCIIYKNISNGSSATKCIFNQSSVSGSTDNCWMGLNNGDIYVAEGEDGTYSESKSFAVKDTYVGTDDTPVGLQGGIGWNKTPTIPSYLIPDDLSQDDEGYYLLSTKINWIQFAEIVNGGTTNANARMTADIDLGDDQTVIGSTTVSTTAHSLGSGTHYQGIFDGQGHTLTVAYNATGSNSASPFSSIEGATIKNLHIDGTMVSPLACGAGVASATGGNGNVIQNVWVSTTITANGQSWNCSAGIVGCVKNGSVSIIDCLFTGSVTSSQSHNGCFVGYIDSGSATVTNCLSTGSFTYGGCDWQGSHTNCYVKQFPASIPAAMQVTDGQLSDGTTAYKLQNNREDLVWGQRIGIDAEPVLTSDENYRVYKSVNGGYTNDPDLAYTGLEQDAEDYYLLGSEWAWIDFAALVNGGTTNANARMTADIDLGDDQTMIGTATIPYQGIFDGQGHTLTVNFNMRDDITGVAPFTCVGDATIQNLHIDGSIIQQNIGAGGIVAAITGNLTIKKCWVSADVKALIGTTAGIACYCDNAAVQGKTILLEDCMFSGYIGQGSYSGSLMSHVHGSDGYNNSAAFTNCLNLGTCDNPNGSTGTFARTGVQGDPYTITNCYYKTAWQYAQGTQATAAQLADGTIATALQAGREEEVWVQDPLTNQPMLALFAGKYKVPSSGLGTFSAKANFALPDGLDAYYCKNYSEGTVSAVAIEGPVAANTGVLLKGTPGETYTLTGTNEAPADITDNALVAVTEATHVDQTSDGYTNFMMSGGKFVKIADSSDPDVKMPANRAYLRLNLGAGSNEYESLALVWDDDPTGIAPLLSPQGGTSHSPMGETEGAWYDLSGRKVKNPTKGIYIQKGKKVLVK